MLGQWGSSYKLDETFLQRIRRSIPEDRVIVEYERGYFEPVSPLSVQVFPESGSKNPGVTINFEKDSGRLRDNSILGGSIKTNFGLARFTDDYIFGENFDGEVLVTFAGDHDGDENRLFRVDPISRRVIPDNAETFCPEGLIQI